MSGPTIPPRPTARSHAAPTSVKQDVPRIPPRPSRGFDQSQSPSRQTYSRSPLNGPPVSWDSGQMYTHDKNLSTSDLPNRPPSVDLPSIGQEGSEYASLTPTHTGSEAGQPEQTRNVAADLPMHQPKAAVPDSTAKSRIKTVTRTDSSQAAAAGIGKSHAEDDKDSEKQSLRARASFNRSNPALATSSRPSSTHEGELEHGIPVIGLQVPMYPNAGDVQAPTPSSSAPPHSSQGIGFFNDGSQRHHHRRRSSRQEFGPPGSYGMHGHGTEPRDNFEKAWYQKHPEEMEKELHHIYDPGHPRGQWAMSSDDLNKLVHSANDSGIGMGVSPDAVGTPTEQVGYMASEQYASRMASPKPVPVPSPLSTVKPRPSSSSHHHAESPLRKTNFPIINNPNDDEALESEAEGETIHLDPPSRRTGKVGGAGYDPPTEDLGPHGGNTAEEGGWIHERGHGVPILASDEIAKRPGSAYLLPAVDPEHENRGGEYHSGYDSDHPPSYQSGRHSRPTSRPGSMHGEPLTRLISQDRHDGSGVGTPLEEIQEYEPLFADDEKEEKPKSAVDKLKRPDALARHHFPSQDVWEDNPNSLALTATVSTPQLPEEADEGAPKTFESPEKETNRKQAPLPTDKPHYLPEETRQFARPHFKPGVLQDIPTRPGMTPRFPSQDIWEDSPDSSRLETTVSTPQTEETSDLPVVNNAPEAGNLRQIPQRPAAAKTSGAAFERKAPIIPERPKPTISSRPKEQNDGTAPVSRDVQPEGAVMSPPLPKSKPAVPSRPAGDKFASIKASFMNDLNSRLQLGPQAIHPKREKQEEAKEEVKAPLTDARKGRAKGPARRKPAASPSGIAESGSRPPAAALFFSNPCVLFSIDEEGQLQVPSESSSAAPGADDIEKIAAENVEAAVPVATATSTADKISLSGLPATSIGAEGDTPEPRLSPGTADRSTAIPSALSEALASPQAQALSSVATETADPKGEMVDSTTQTGQQDIAITSPEGETEKLTTYLGGRAAEKGNIVVKHDIKEERNRKM